ncbi:MAG: hypothetical protein ACKVH8_18625 [Pirellulales bacterium]
MVFGTKILIYLAIATLMLHASVRVGCCCDNLVESTQQAASCPNCVKANPSNAPAISGETIGHDCQCKSHVDQTMLIASSSKNKEQSPIAIAWQMEDRLTVLDQKPSLLFTVQHTSQGHLPGVLQSLLCRWTT